MIKKKIKTSFQLAKISLFCVVLVYAEQSVLLQEWPNKFFFYEA
jgi:hypothetical protein